MRCCLPACWLYVAFCCFIRLFICKTLEIIIYLFHYSWFCQISPFSRIFQGRRHRSNFFLLSTFGGIGEGGQLVVSLPVIVPYNKKHQRAVKNKLNTPTRSVYSFFQRSTIRGKNVALATPGDWGCSLDRRLDYLPSLLVMSGSNSPSPEPVCRCWA